MPCYQSTNLPSGFSTTGRTSYKTEAECNQACKEGACCEGTSCSVKPQCQCQGEGKVFKGVGTVCSTGRCDPCFEECESVATTPTALLVTVSNWQGQYSFRDYQINGAYTIPRAGGSCFAYGLRDRANQCLVNSSTWPELIAGHDLVINVDVARLLVAMKGCRPSQTGCDCFQFRADIDIAINYCQTSTLSGVATASHAFSYMGSAGTFSWSIAPASNPLP
jgi:hypothetical protein